MKRQLRLSLLALLVACESSPAPAGDAPPASGPPSAAPATAAIPTPAFYVARGVCPFECCHYGPWIAKDGRRGWVLMNDAKIGGVDLCS